MSPIPTETTISETASVAGVAPPFKDLRGVQWRIDLGILPPSASASVDDLRRVTANSRRRYAALRRRLLVDPHVPKDGSSSPDVVIDNPLSQNPDSIWGRFFRNAELEKMVDQDLTRLYPERGSFFQTSGCQGILRRILLLWCLRHPEYGYRQGMHELLAPLLYVLHVDLERLSEVRKLYDDHFTDKFDGFSFHENDLTFKFDFKKFSDSEGYLNGYAKSYAKSSSLRELEPEIQIIVSLSDAYGAEGELGVVLSEKFMEHDAYSMFDALMSGVGGAVAMAGFLSPHSANSQTGFPPVIEASASLYHLLSVVDSSLHSHLVELGIEPQYFALRWLRVLFGREFSLENLLLIWDEIFAHVNTKSDKDAQHDAESNFGVLESPRGAFISSFAVSMILNLRSSLLATETATSCLQRLLNFPNDVKLVKLIAKAKSLQDLAADANKLISLPIHTGLYNEKKSVATRGHSLSLDFSSSPKTPSIIPDSYWEEKWRVLHKEEQKQGANEGQVLNRRKGWSERVKLHLSRTESGPSPSKKNDETKISRPSVRRSLLEDLAQRLKSGEGNDDSECNEDVSHQDEVVVYEQDVNGKKFEIVKVNEQNVNDVKFNGQDIIDNNFGNMSSGSGSEDNSSSSSDPPSPIHGYSEHDNESERSSVASNSSVCENDADSNNVETFGTSVYSSPLPLEDPPDDGLSSKCSLSDDSKEKLATDIKGRKLLSGKFQWLWKLGRNSNEGTSDRKVVPEDEKACKGNGQSSEASVSTADGGDISCGTSKGETVDQNLIVSLRNLGQSMLENIQVIESVFQQDRGQTGSLDNFSNNGLGNITAMSALKELRKISNILSEM